MTNTRGKEVKDNTNCFFVSDLHGKLDRYEKLFEQIRKEKPEIVFFGGDLYPSFKLLLNSKIDFFEDIFVKYFEDLYSDMGDDYPEFFIILGNDDPKSEEVRFQDKKFNKLWNYIHNRKNNFKGYEIYGYANIPPSPFIYKDWELYDVSRYVDPGSIHPTEGKRSVDPQRDIEYATIKKDLEKLFSDINPNKTIVLFHSPPFKSNLDRADLEGKYIDHVPMDVHVGSIAIKEFIENKQPLLTMHGHIHESSRLTGSWKQITGKTHSFNAAIDTNQLSIITFDIKMIKNAQQEIF